MRRVSDQDPEGIAPRCGAPRQERGRRRHDDVAPDVVPGAHDRRGSLRALRNLGRDEDLLGHLGRSIAPQPGRRRRARRPPRAPHEEARSGPPCGMPLPGSGRLQGPSGLPPMPVPWRPPPPAAALGPPPRDPDRPGVWGHRPRARHPDPVRAPRPVPADPHVGGARHATANLHDRRRRRSGNHQTDRTPGGRRCGDRNSQRDCRETSHPRVPPDPVRRTTGPDR